jgi:hypothetical protein
MMRDGKRRKKREKSLSLKKTFRGAEARNADPRV